MKKKLPIGISDFNEIITGSYYYIDKSLLIEELLSSGKVALISRPRRFGKTLNLSMMRYFYELKASSTTNLFTSLNIWQNERCREEYGQFPVIFLTFKNIFQETFDETLQEFAFTIAKEYERHAALVESPHLAAHEKERFTRFRQATASKEELANSLEFLSFLLAKYHKRSVVILIDEYDVPIQSAYINQFYDRAILFIRQLLTGALKDNKDLHKGVLTGVMTLAKAGIFSGLNNLDIYNLTHDNMADKFGFTADEAEKMLLYYEVKDHEGIKKWYNGYVFGKMRGIVNPWSLLKCVQAKGLLEIYWANTSDNVLLKRLIAQSSSETKTELEKLLTGDSIEKIIEESIVYADIEQQNNLIWSVLLFTGYLTYTRVSVKEGKKECSLAIPNEEIRFLYRDLIRKLFSESLSDGRVQELLRALLSGESEIFAELLKNFIIRSMSVYDLSSTEPERSYHLFILGLLVMLSEKYEVRSNRESGIGRYDIMIVPKQKKSAGVILEFKRVLKKKNEATLDEAAQQALDQIIEKKYAQELYGQGVQKVYAYGIAFEGKNLSVRSCLL